jgi:hypothetical protein
LKKQISIIIRLKCWTWTIWRMDGKKSIWTCLLGFALKTVKQLPSRARFTFIQKGRIGHVVF